ncbi:hypothetical protein Tco_0447246, partial [Tanacetum coccineum]
MEEVDSDLESMPDYEIVSILVNEDEDDNSKDLSMVDEIATNNVIDKLGRLANKGMLIHLFLLHLLYNYPLCLHLHQPLLFLQ